MSVELFKNDGINSTPSTNRIRLVNVLGFFRFLDPQKKQHRIVPEPGTPVHATYATQTLTLTGRAVADETIEVGGVTYTWKAVAAEANEVEIGAATAADDILALVAAINASTAGSDEDLYGAGTVENPYWSAADGTGDTVVLTARQTGPVAGGVNTEDMANASFGSLTDGDYATTAQAGDMLYDASFLYFANVDIGRFDTEGWQKFAVTPL